MAVLKQTSPTAWPAAPSPVPCSTVPSASTSTAVGLGSLQPAAGAACLSFIAGLPPCGCRKPQGRLSQEPTAALSAKGIAMLRDDINNALKTAMKAQEPLRVSTLRMVNSTIKNADIQARGENKQAPADEELLGLLQKMIKQRQESVQLYNKSGPRRPSPN